MRKISRGVRFTVNDYLRSVYNPHRLLSPFFWDVPSFRSLQARTGSLISGHSALHFFNRSLRPTDPLDLYIYFHHRREVVDWLLAAGYGFSPSLAQSSDLDYAVADGNRDNYETDADPPHSWGSLTFHLHGAQSNVTVRVFIAMKSPMEMILHSHSSELLRLNTFEASFLNP